MSGKIAILAVCCAALAACAEKSLYSWNGYSSELLSYYKNPGEQQKFADRLLEDIEKAEEENAVPPGLYAEYGYMMLELGNTQEAVVYFEKEQQKWPESALLMGNIIGRVVSLTGAQAEGDQQ